ncbi:MAG TPA: RagB/SusD family nutrient uptake outer membrane protein [Gemmatimonadaceae bacterium]
MNNSMRTQTRAEAGGRSTVTRHPRARRALRLALVAGASFAAAACSDFLKVPDPVNLTPEDLAGGAPVSLTVNGVRGAFQSMFDYYVLHTSLITDEMVTAGTFPYRAEMDARAIASNNDGLRTDLYVPLSTARFMADTAAAILTDAQGAEGVDEAERLAGIASAKFYGAYTRTLLAEAFCKSAINGGPGLTSDERMQDALAAYQDAGAAAQAAGDVNLVAASKLGEARAQLWLRDFPAAAAAASQVPASLSLKSYYSGASVAQKSKVVRFTYGIDEAIRWTIGDGSLAFTGHEKWPYFEEWEQLGLLEISPERDSFNPAVPVVVQTKYVSPDAAITISSGAEAELIVAEAKLRAADPSGAAAIVNQLRNDNWGLPAISFSGNLAQDLPIMARERARELWLTGERIATLRRYLADDVNLWPGDKQGTDTCFPVPQLELDTNKNF